MPKLQNVQALRGLAAMLVVFSHLCRIEEKYAGDPLLPAWFQHGSAGVDLFFVISGFIMVAITHDPRRGAAAARDFLARRVARIYPLYWFYTAIVLAVALVRPTWVNQSYGHQYDLLASLLLAPQDGGALLAVAWTLEHEVYFYLVFAVTLWLTPPRWLGAVLAAWVTATVVGVMLAPTPSSAVAELLVKPYAIEFAAGCAIGMLLGRDASHDRRAAWIVLALCAVVVAAMVDRSTIGIDEPPRVPIDHYRRLLLFGVPAALLVAGAVLLERRGRIAPRWLCRLGDGSYSIYLSHVLVLSAVGRAWATFATDGIADNLAMLPLCIAFVIGAGMASYYVVERPMLEWFQRRRGRALGPDTAQRNPG